MRVLTELRSAIVCAWLVIRTILRLPFTGFRSARYPLLLALERERQRTGGRPIAQFGILCRSGSIVPIRSISSVAIESPDGRWEVPVANRIGNQEMYVIASGIKVMNPSTGTKGMLVTVQPTWQSDKQS